jgi:VanZ family protein
MTTENNLKVQNPNTAEKIIRLFAPLVWAVIILWLSLTSSPPQLPGLLGWDKLLHAGAYGLLTLLIAQYLLSTSLSPGKIWWHAGLVAVCFGALLEIMQILVQTGRTAEWGDLFADAVGAFLSCVIFRQMLGVVCQRHDYQDKRHG